MIVNGDFWNNFTSVQNRGGDKNERKRARCIHWSFRSRCVEIAFSPPRKCTINVAHTLCAALTYVEGLMSLEKNQNPLDEPLKLDRFLGNSRAEHERETCVQHSRASSFHYRLSTNWVVASVQHVEGSTRTVSTWEYHPVAFSAIPNLWQPSSTPSAPRRNRDDDVCAS